MNKRFSTAMSQDNLRPVALERADWLITDSALSARLVYEGSNPGRETVADPEFTEDNTIFDHITDIIAGWTITDPCDWAGPVIAENRALWHETLGTTPAKETAIQLIAALHTPAVRDRIIADTISTDDNPETFATVLTGRYTGTPDWDHVDATQELLIDLLRFTPPEARTPSSRHSAGSTGAKAAAPSPPNT